MSSVSATCRFSWSSPPTGCAGSVYANRIPPLSADHCQGYCPVERFHLPVWSLRWREGGKIRRRKVEGGMRKVGVLIGTLRLLFLPQSLLLCMTSSDCLVRDFVSSGGGREARYAWKGGRMWGCGCVKMWMWKWGCEYVWWRCGWESECESVKLLNRLYSIDTYWRHTTFSLWCHFQQCPWDLGSAPAERVGQGEVGGFQPWAQVTWLLLGLAVESPWSSPVSHFSAHVHERA